MLRLLKIWGYCWRILIFHFSCPESIIFFFFFYVVLLLDRFVFEGCLPAHTMSAYGLCEVTLASGCRMPNSFAIPFLSYAASVSSRWTSNRNSLEVEAMQRKTRESDEERRQTKENRGLALKTPNFTTSSFLFFVVPFLLLQSDHTKPLQLSFFSFFLLLTLAKLEKTETLFFSYRLFSQPKNRQPPSL